MVRLTGVLSQINSQKVMVLGDFMLDTYTIGKARRISPEAPVAIIQVQREEHRPGGAGNVVLNLTSLGSKVIAVGRVGADSAGNRLKSNLVNEGVDVRGLFVQDDFPTPLKNRILAENQQIVRVDHESITPLSEQLEHDIVALLPILLDDVRVIAISDYGKGFLSRHLLHAVIQMAKQRKIAIIADPKGVDFSKYAGATILKPNLGEAYAAANLTPDAPLEIAANRILQNTAAETLMITRSEAGISLFHKNGQRQDFPVRVREVKDVTGAGDTVLATLACALANSLDLSTASRLCNVTAGMAIERFGCARISLTQLARRLLEEDVANKVFDEEHLFALQAVLKEGKFTLLSLSSLEGITTNILKVVRQLGQKEGDLLIYVRDASPDPEFISLLAALHDVDFILLQTESVRAVCELIVPEEVYVVDSSGCQKVASFQEAIYIVN